MKTRPHLCLLAIALAACATSPPTPPATVDARTYLEQCRDAGWNVTFESALEAELDAARVPAHDPGPLSGEELEAHLDRVLAGHGLAAKRIGPLELRALLIHRAG